MKSPTPDQMENNHCIKPAVNLINHNESFSENNELLPDEDKVMIILNFYSN